MKIKATREVKKREEYELEFTKFDALELVSQFRYRKVGSNTLDTFWNEINVCVTLVGDDRYEIVIYSDLGARYFYISFEFEEH